jgi:hypothetical protein
MAPAMVVYLGLLAWRKKGNDNMYEEKSILAHLKNNGFKN